MKSSGMVKGTVMEAKGVPLNNHVVIIYARDLDKTEKIGKTKTNVDGTYTVKYSLPENITTANIQIKVFATPQSRKPLSASPLILNAEPIEIINLSVGDETFKSRSEFEVVAEALKTLSLDTDAEKLNAAEIALLSNKSQLSSLVINSFLQAKEDAKVANVSSQALYALYRSGAESQLNLVAMQDKSKLKTLFTKAAKQNLIPELSEQQKNTAINGLQKNKIKQVLSSSGSDFNNSSALFKTAGLSEAEQEKILKLVLQKKGDGSAVWKKLDTGVVISKAKAKKLKLVTELDVLALNQSSLTEALANDQSFNNPKELAIWDRSTWESFLKQNNVKLPSFVGGKDQTEKLTNYATIMQKVLEDTYTSTVLANGWNFNNSLDNKVGKFFTKNQDFDFEQHNINKFLSDNSNAFSGIASSKKDKQLLSHNLRSLQNLYHITPRFNKLAAIKPLWDANLTSSHQIKTIGAKAFVEKYEMQLGGVERANFIYANAQKIANKALLMKFRFGHDMNGPMPYVIPITNLSDASAIEPNPTMSYLFGNLDYCQCKHCRSVLSPAAYFVDLLLYLKDTQVDGVNGESGLEVLFKRRPDLGNIELSCDNTNIVVPHIDLVNEILEDAISPRAYQKLVPQGSDTTVYEAQISQTVETRMDIQQAMAEHLNSQSYEELRKVTNAYPWAGPYNLWQDEAQAYLHQLGVSRHQLMKVLEKPTVSTAADQAAVQLDISVNEKRILTEAASNTAISKRWGVSNWKQLKAVEILLQQAKLEYSELQEILALQSIPEFGASVVKVDFDADHPCSLSHAELIATSGGDIPSQWFDFFHRFIRLSHRASISFQELDQVLMASAETNINDNVLVYLASLKNLGEVLNQPIARIVELFQLNLTTHRYHNEVASRYEQIFLSSGIGELTEQMRAVLSLNNSVDEISDVTLLLTDSNFSSLILSASNIEQNELDTLIESELSGNATMNLASLSYIYRIGQFCDLTDIPVVDYLSLRRGLRLQPLTTMTDQGNPENSLKFIQVYEDLSYAELSLAEINYIVYHDKNVSGANNLSDSDVEQLLQTLNSAVEGSNSDKDSIDSEALEPTLAVLLQTISDELDVPVGLCEVMLADISNPLDDAQSAAQLLLINEPSSDQQEQQRLVLIRLYKVTMILSLLPDEAEQLLVLKSADSLNWLVFNDLLDAEPANDDENNLASSQFTGLVRLLQNYKSITNVFLPEYSLSSLMTLAMTSSSKSDVVSYLSIATGWPEFDISILLARFSINRIKMRNVDWLDSLAKVFKVLNSLGCGVSMALNWVEKDVSFVEATQIRALVKSKYSESSWLTIAPDLRDPVRERQRDALLGYVLHQGLPKDPSKVITASNKVSFKDKDELFLYLLVDAQISSCLDTSRIKQAISSVQLFVQQIIMGIDAANIEMSAVDTKQWQWRKNYRVWEANRKVFLYPENWIYPELRNDKSVFFKEMEEELAQVDLNKNTAKDVYLNYLNKLNSVAQLDVCGVYEHFDDVTEKTSHHVFARTKAHPHVYYYRRWVDKSYWTPWESMNLDIEGDHLVPTIYRGRLFLFWPKFVEKSIEPTSSDLKADLTEEHKASLPKQYYEIQMAWSEYKNGKWSEMQLSVDYIASASKVGTPFPKSDFYFYTYELSDSLVVTHNRFDFSSSENPNSFGVNTPSVTVSEVFAYSDMTNSLEAISQSSLASRYQSKPDQQRHINVNMLNNLNLAKMPNSDNHNMHFIKMANSKTFELLTAAEHSYLGPRGAQRIAQRNYTSNVLLENAISGFRVMLPQQFDTYLSQSPLFYADGKRTFFITPRDDYEREVVSLPSPDWDIIFEPPIITNPPKPPEWADPPNPPILQPSGPNPRPIPDFGNFEVSPDFKEEDIVFEEINTPVFNGTGLEDMVIDRHVENEINGLNNKNTFAFTDELALLMGSDTAVDSGTFGHSELNSLLSRNAELHETFNPDITANRLTSIPRLLTVRPGFVSGITSNNVGFRPEIATTESAILSETFANIADATKLEPLTYKVDADYLLNPSSTLYRDRFWNGFHPDVRIRMKKVKRYQFFNFYHPFVPMMIQQLNREGIDGLLKPELNNNALSDADKLLRQQYSKSYFEAQYDPTTVVDKPYPIENFDFSFTGAYSHYNWELFFHGPLLIAERLMQNKRFEESRDWLHYIFDPTNKDDNESAPKCFWKIKPFFDYEGEYSIQKFIELLNNGDAEIEAQLAALEENPFNPHLLARMRQVAYMKKVVTTYIDNLIAWGDYLFTRDSMESVNEATQLYVLAAQILGRRPQQVEKDSTQSHTFNQLLPKFDEMGNAIVSLEADIAAVTEPVNSGGAEVNEDPTLDSILYFCVPNNEQILDYWDTVADRLYKIRHCMNIEGVRRSLALFQPPIDPAMLVKATASGMSFDSIMDSISAPLPHYRFTFILQKANEFCGDVKALGSAFLQALEKQDGEQMALLRASHQITLQESLREVKLKSIEEAQQALEVIAARKQSAAIRRDYYMERLAGDSVISDIDIPGLPIPSISINDAELVGLGLSSSAILFQAGGVAANIIAGVMTAIPNFQAGASGAGGSPHVTAITGGQSFGKVAQLVGQGLSGTAGVLSSGAQLANTIGSYMRRDEDWALQLELANAEHDGQLEQEKISAEIRLASTEKDLESHDLQILHAESEADLLESKFTNKELYNWMSNQLSQLYFASYEVAHQLAKTAEQCYQFELVDSGSNIVKSGNWDGLKKGLLAGEKLQKDLRRLEKTYLDNNRRYPELSKNISLAQLDPEKLLTLKQTGECEFILPEVIFDMDHPGHYMRRIKNISLSIPCIVGPYTSIAAKLTLLESRIRKDTSLSGGYEYQGINDTRFTPDTNAVGIKSIATSNAQNDSGMFEVNFRDERYLPFEGAGAISHWKLEMPKEFRQFDYESIADVIIQVQYTAREDAGPFKEGVTKAIKDSLNKVKEFLSDSETGMDRIFSARQEFGNDWHRFMNPLDNSDTQQLSLALNRRHFPQLFSDREVEVQNLQLLLMLKNPDDYSGSSLPVSISVAGSAISPIPKFSASTFESQPLADSNKKFDIESSGDVLIVVTINESDIDNLNGALLVDNDGKSRLNIEAVNDVLLIINYHVGGELN